MATAGESNTSDMNGHTDTKQKTLPPFVTIRVEALDDSLEILLDDNVKRLIVRETWNGDLSKRRYLDKAENMEDCWETYDEYALLAHVAAEPAAQQCQDCNGEPFSECRVNAVWPGFGACTNCSHNDDTRCSFWREESLNDQSLALGQRRSVDTGEEATSLRELSWEKWLTEGLRLVQDREKAMNFHKSLVASQSAVEKLIEMTAHLSTESGGNTAENNVVEEDGFIKVNRCDVQRRQQD